MRASDLTEKWSKKYKSSINCNNPKGFSQRAHCAGRKKHNESQEAEVDRDALLIELCELVVERQKQDPEQYGMVGACILGPNGEKAYGTSTRQGDKWAHAERMAINDYEDKYGPVDSDCAVVTTLSPCSTEMIDREGESCTDLIASKGITDVYAGYQDPTQQGHYTVTDNQKIQDFCQKLADTFLTEAFNQPYKTKWESSDYGDVDALARLPDGSPLSIMFNQQQDADGEAITQVEFYRNNSQEVTGEGDAQRVFATVLAAIQKYIKKYKPLRLTFSASKLLDPSTYYEPDAPQPNPESRASLYDRLVQRYARAWGYRAFRADNGDLVIYELSRINKAVEENFADGKKPGRKGLAKRSGVNCKQSVSKLRSIAKNSSGEKQRMAHWCANMKSGKK